MGRTQTSDYRARSPAEYPHLDQRVQGTRRLTKQCNCTPELLGEPTKGNTDFQPCPDPYNRNFQGWSMESAGSPLVVLKHDLFKYENLF